MDPQKHRNVNAPPPPEREGPEQEHESAREKAERKASDVRLKVERSAEDVREKARREAQRVGQRSERSPRDAGAELTTAGEEVGREARETGRQLKQDARALSAGAREAAESWFESQRHVLADEADGFAHALRSAAETLEDEQHQTSASLCRRGAEQIERFAEHTESRSFERLMSDAEDMARRQPGLFLGGAMMAGFFASRFFKSSAERGREGGHHGYAE